MTPPIDPQAVTLRIRELVAMRGGVTEAARLSGVFKPTLEPILAGKNMPGAMTLAQLSVGLKVSIDWILFGKSSAERKASGEVHQ